MDRAELKLPNGWVVYDCGLKLLTKYLGAESSLVFDLYAKEQLAKPGLRNRVSWSDGIASEAMTSNLGVAKWTRLASAPVSVAALAPDRALDAPSLDDSTVFDALAGVHSALGISSPESVAQVFKVLAVKRPALYPMIDNVVSELFSAKPFKLDRWPWPQERALDSIWDAVRYEVRGVARFLMREFLFMLDSVEAEAPGLLDGLSEWLALQLQALGVASGLRLSRVRVLDSLVGFDWNRIAKGGVLFAKQGWARDNDTLAVRLEGDPAELSAQLAAAWGDEEIEGVRQLVAGLVAAGCAE